MTSPFSIESIADHHIEGLQAAIETVARERRYLAAARGFSVDEIRTFSASLVRDGGIQFVALSAERVVGWCDVRRHRFEGFRHGGVLGIGLLQEWRERGVGTALLARTLEAASAAGMTRVELDVFLSNTRAVRLFERAGFVREGVKHRARILDGRVDDLLCMARLT